jgi:purine-binding chemotaxis protein CheW
MDEQNEKKIKNADISLRELVTFNIGEEEFGIDILKVQEIIRMVEITKVPKAPEFVEGVINLRGKVIPVINFRKRFGMETKEDSKETRIIVVEIESKILSFIVDSVSEVLRLPVSSIESAPSVVSRVDSSYIYGVGKLEDRLLILINIDRLLSEKELLATDKAVA